MYLCYQEPAPGYISKLISGRRACHLGSCIAYSSSSPVFTSPPPAALVLALLRRSCFTWSPMPSRPLLFLYRLARVHQEDRSSSLARSRPLLKDVLTNAPSVSSQHFGCPSHLSTQNVLSKCTPKNVLFKYTPKNVLPSAHPRTCYPSAHPRTCYPSAHPRTCYPSAHPRTCYSSAHSERAIQVHTQERAIQVHTQNVLSKCMVYSCTTTTRTPISCTSTLVHQSRAPPISCTTNLVHHQSRAPLVLVHLSCITPCSCTAP